MQISPEQQRTRGVFKKVWSMDDVVTMVEEWERQQ